jgi:transcription initiation factor IIE alpha subunit
LPILITSQYYQCPKCKLRLYDRLYNNDKEYLITNYCPNCGQRLETIGKTRKYYKEHEKELEEKDKKYIDKLFKEEDGV